MLSIIQLVVGKENMSIADEWRDIYTSEPIATKARYFASSSSVSPSAIYRRK